MSLTRKLYYRLPTPLRYIARRIWYLPYDLTHRKVYSNGLKLPPKGLVFTGGGDFIEAGERFHDLFKSYCHITPQAKVLDIGSGMGRMAFPFTEFLSSEGEYYGIDVVEKAVKWCNQNIGSKFSNFKFIYTSIQNDLYRNSGLEADLYQFQMPDQYFDLVFLVSVFTHMQKEGVENYIKEISRMLKNNAHCLISLFLFNEFNELKENNFNPFFLQDETQAFMDQKVKSANVAFKKDWFFKLCNNNGLTVSHFTRGSWINSTSISEDFQDILVVKKAD